MLNVLKSTPNTHKHNALQVHVSKVCLPVCLAVAVGTYVLRTYT